MNRCWRSTNKPLVSSLLALFFSFSLRVFIGSCFCITIEKLWVIHLRWDQTNGQSVCHSVCPAEEHRPPSWPRESPAGASRPEEGVAEDGVRGGACWWRHGRQTQRHERISNVPWPQVCVCTFLHNIYSNFTKNI